MGQLYSSSDKVGNMMEKTAIIGIFLLLIGAMPMVSGQQEDLQTLNDYQSSSSGAMLGWNITGVGDFDGDGDEDYGVGAPGENKVYIFDEPLDNSFSTSTADWSATGPSGSDFGWDLQGMGDFDGDGRDDLIVGAPGENKAYVFRGTTGSGPGSHSSADFTLEGTAGEDFGHSVCGLNFDGDEGWFAVVGAPKNEHYVESADADLAVGAVFLFNLTYFDEEGENALTASTDANFTYKGEEENGMFGFVVRNMGKINSDSIDDLGMSDPYYSSGGITDRGSFYLQYGKSLIASPPEALTSNLDGLVSGPGNFSMFGWSARGIGDVKGSGEDDFFVGAPFGGSSGEGEAYLIRGASSSLSLDLSTSTAGFDLFNGSYPGDRFGMSFDRTMLSGASPIILSIGAPGYDNGTMIDAGAVYSFWSWSAVESANNAPSMKEGDSAGENLGYSLCDVNYTYKESPNEYLNCVFAGSPYHGASDNGRIQVMRRNRLPSLGSITWDRNKGSESRIFTIRMEYSDPDNDPPAEIEVDFYYDNSGDNLAKNVPLSRQPADDDTFSGGVTYEAQTTLPSSITPNEPNKPLYLKGSAMATRGSIAEVISQNGMVDGPTIDGVPPSAPDNLNEEKYTSLPDEELIPGTFKILFEWPEDNNGYQNAKSEKVSSMEIRYLSGNQTIDASNWDDATIYKKFSASQEIGEPNQRDEILMGEDSSVFDPMMYYSVAMRATDDVGNTGSISSTVSAQAYWVRPVIPGPCTLVAVSDYKGEDGDGDDGGQLQVDFSPPQISNPSDIGEYRVFVTQVISGLGNVSDIDWEPDLVITKDDEEGFYNYSFVLDSYHGGDLVDGESYYVGVVPVNWLNQHAKAITWSQNAVKVINDDQPAIPKIQNVDAESINGEEQIRVTWEPTSLDRFTEYRIYGKPYFFNDINEAEHLGTVTDISTSEFIVEEIAGDPIEQSNLYSFAVLVKDHNDHMDKELDANNTVHGVKYIAPDPAEIPAQVKGVSMTDVPNDGGGALTVSWFKSFSNIFWQYNVYFDDQEIEDITQMEPVKTITSDGKTDFIIDEFQGEPLVDGMYYHAVVTIVDWNLMENTRIDDNNTAMAKPINQSDFTPPTVVPSNLRVEGEPQNREFTIMWDPVSKDDVIDFNHYLVTYSSEDGVETIIIGDDPGEDINTNSVTIDRLTRGTEYYVNISVVDDNGNHGPGSDSMTVVTAGQNTAPQPTQIIITIGEELFYLKNETDTANIDLNEVSIIYFQGEAEDDYTRASNLLFSWNITLPSGESIEKTGYQFDLELSDKGTYTLELVVIDEEGLESEPFTIDFTAEKETETTETNWFLLIGAVVVVLIIAIAVIVLVLFSGSKSQKKQRLEEYRARRQEIDSMEPIHTNLPTWTCDCGTTQVPITEHAYCNSCYQSHEAVPITGIDDYLKEHDLVLSEMKIEVPPGWQGQDAAIKNAEKDLEERKERALKALNQEFAPFLKGTEYEKELEDLEEEGAEDEEGQSSGDRTHHPGAIVPGQAPPSGGTPQGPGQPGPIQPTVGGQPQGQQQGQIKPPQVPQAGAPGQKPPMPQVGNQQNPPRPPQQQ